MGIIARAIKAASGTINFLASSAAKASEVNSDFNTVYSLVNGNLDNDNISSTAGIGPTKLATITTAGKVNGSALISLDSIPAGAGLIPAANLPASSAVNLESGVTGVLPIENGGTGGATAALAIDALTDASSGDDGQVWTTDGTNGSWADINNGAYSVGSLVEATAATERINTSNTYALLKQFNPLARAGTINISFSAATNTSAKAKIYVNDIAVGVEKSISGAYTTYTDSNISVKTGDLLQVYGHTFPGGSISVKDFKILVSNPTTPAEATGY